MRILVHGATGRMGRAVIALAAQDPHIVLAAAVTRDKHPLLGVDAGEQAGVGTSGISLISRTDLHEKHVAEDIDVVIDFSNAQAFDTALEIAGQLDACLVSGTTGITEEQWLRLEALSHHQSALWAANMSPAIAVMGQIVKQAAHALPDADIEIVETHHRFKKDAPSGTALTLAKKAAKGRGQSVKQAMKLDRCSDQHARRKGEIGMSVVRGGDVAGTHQVGFYLDGEYLELCHRATDRSIFARGALRAAHWLLKQPPALYRMSQVLKGE